MSRVGWMNGSLVDESKATLSVFDHGLLYGDGVFEGIRYYDRRIFRGDAHLARLRQSARAIDLALPYSTTQLQHALASVVEQSSTPDGYLRLVITRGIGDLGLNPRSCARAQAFIVTGTVTIVNRNDNAGAAVIIASTRQTSPDQLDPRIKSLNYLPRILARIEANRAGADEAIMLNPAGHIAEGTGDNVFIVRNGILLTPPTTDGALEGITRAVILELAATANIRTAIQSLSPLDLRTADEAFLTGTAAELIPIHSVDGLPLVTGPIFQQLEQAFRTLVRQEST